MILTLPVSEFPHSETHGSLRTYRSPWHFAVSRVLHRLLVPRHPLCALCLLTLQITFNSLRNLSLLIDFFFKIYATNISNFQRSIITINIVIFNYDNEPKIHWWA